MRAIIGIVGLMCSTQVAFANHEDCRDAKHEYKQAKDEISDYVRRYVSCVSSSDGHDDCESEFRSLKDSQEEFEEAVQKIESECD